ncbi:hypothetical protein GGF45_003432 [Coemansia sp. RSA 551]|nr:hypothetical protein J3F82_003244 [Coemansia sp. RSA 637]KAJ2177046.1 hypothetical protein GGF45_003432 [Coemansia sp. RSA 551]
MTDKKNLNWEISVLEAQTGTGKSLWKAKAKETKRQREKAKRDKQAAKSADQGSTAATITPDSNNTEDAEAKLQKLRKEKVDRKLYTIQKRSKALVSKLVQFEQQRLKRKIQDSTESSNEELEKDSETTKGLPLDGLVECMMHRIKKRSPALAKAYDVQALSSELQELNSSKCVQRVLGAKQAVVFIKDNSTDLTEVLTGTKSRDNKQSKPREEPSTSEAKSAPKQVRSSVDDKTDLDGSIAGGSDGYESTSDLDADPTSKFVGSLDGNVSDVSVSDYEHEGLHKNSKQRKRQRNPDDYDEDADKEFMKLYHGNGDKKNRPGQRQRRRQHEREFGNDANHIKLLEKEKAHSNSRQRLQPQPHAAVASQPKAKEQTMHPSWEAKRRERELLEQAKTVKGQRIVFD